MPGTSADVLIWDCKGPHRVKDHFREYEVATKCIVVLIVLCLWEGGVLMLAPKVAHGASTPSQAWTTTSALAKHKVTKGSFKKGGDSGVDVGQIGGRCGKYYPINGVWVAMSVVSCQSAHATFSPYLASTSQPQPPSQTIYCPCTQHRVPPACPCSPWFPPFPPDSPRGSVFPLIWQVKLS